MPPQPAYQSEVSEVSDNDSPVKARGAADLGALPAAPPVPNTTRPTAHVPAESLVRIKATRLARLFSGYTVEQCMEVLRVSNYDLGEAIEKLRPKTERPPPPRSCA